MMQQPLPVPPPANVSGQQQAFMPQPAAAPLLAADGVGSASLVDATAQAVALVPVSGKAKKATKCLCGGNSFD